MIRRGLLLFSLLSACFGSYADIVNIETNDWSDSRRLVWTGTLQSIDPKTGLASFEFKNRDRIETFSVHVTRLYSLVLDSQDRVNRDFPSVRQNLEKELPTNPRSKRKLQLSNQNFVVDDIPSDVRVRPSRTDVIIYLNGEIKRADLQEILIEARAKNQGASEFKISRSDLMAWIR